MDEKFERLIESLHDKYTKLMSMEPVTIDTVPTDCPVGGVYLFSNNDENLYAGRTKRKISIRLRGHVNTADDCPFAWRLAREKMGTEKAIYKQKGSRKDFLTTPAFRQLYESANDQIRDMDVRYVEESEPLQQALLEIYVSVVANAKYNDFGTH